MFVRSHTGGLDRSGEDYYKNMLAIIYKLEVNKIGLFARAREYHQRWIKSNKFHYFYQEIDSWFIWNGFLLTKK